MRRLKLYILIFSVALALPLAYLVVRTNISLRREESAELRYFAEALFNDMEDELALFVQREERRPVDAYSSNPEYGAEFADASYLLGYLQNNPDGSYLAVIPRAGSLSREGERERQAELDKINNLFNARRREAAKKREKQLAEARESDRLMQEELPHEAQIVKEQALEEVRKEVVKKSPLDLRVKIPGQAEQKGLPNVADRYLDQRRTKQNTRIGMSERRVEEVTASQLKTMAGNAPPETKDGAASKKPTEAAKPPPPGKSQVADKSGESLQEAELKKVLKEMELERQRKEFESVPEQMENATIPDIVAGAPAMPGDADNEYAMNFGSSSEYGEPSTMDSYQPRNGQKAAPTRTFQAEVDPMQSVLIENSWIFVFRRIVIANRIYRQGFVLDARDFLQHLMDDYFKDQPMARFTHLSLEVMDQGAPILNVGASLGERNGDFVLERYFTRPFSFLRATLLCESIPRSEGRKTLGWVTAILAVVILIGLLSIYQSTRMVLDLSERRAGFVSSVTHEIKTPLTNIKLYIEMLEQGMARDPDRRRHYYSILNSETVRLSRLIQNVLEFSKLERKQRALNMHPGNLEDVLTEITQLMQDKLQREGFTLRVVYEEPVNLLYDREVMLQVLLNLLENSMKFGKDQAVKEITIWVRPDGERVRIVISDTGPGIPRKALKKVFEDFYRVDNSLTRRTQGTGIGLALVLRFVSAMGGSVNATNNEDAGCSITMELPALAQEREEKV